MNAIALMRRQLWLTSQVFSRSGVEPDSQKVQPPISSTHGVPCLRHLKMRKVQTVGRKQKGPDHPGLFGVLQRAPGFGQRGLSTFGPLQRSFPALPSRTIPPRLSRSRGLGPPPFPELFQAHSRLSWTSARRADPAALTTCRRAQLRQYLHFPLTKIGRCGGTRPAMGGLLITADPLGAAVNLS